MKTELSHLKAEKPWQAILTEEDTLGPGRYKRDAALRAKGLPVEVFEWPTLRDGSVLLRKSEDLKAKLSKFIDSLIFTIHVILSSLAFREL